MKPNIVPRPHLATDVLELMYFNRIIDLSYEHTIIRNYMHMRSDSVIQHEFVLYEEADAAA